MQWLSLATYKQIIHNFIKKEEKKKKITKQNFKIVKKENILKKHDVHVERPGVDGIRRHSLQIQHDFIYRVERDRIYK